MSRTLVVIMKMKFLDVFFSGFPVPQPKSPQDIVGPNFIAIVTSNVIWETEQRIQERISDKLKLKEKIIEFMEAERGTNIEAVLNKFCPLVKIRW
jgi:hypothetical protein